ncbi:FGFR1 oncogene partner isoform X2 [Corythoichthys intestinalis]|uniref:FGFR1 oncogene partner isoform X2 n=1 Tax=Corythoichthys intestinalis TaxID=161448 RepID=UPI0025A58648|nr:FGFR1 oncogene partner isoform X2 [Corythoichthys intestinalis]
MSAADDDTELRDLVIQNLENNGVLNKLKAEMRAAVFLALEEQDRLENKTPLVNDHLKKCLSTKEGRLVAGLIVDFMRVFHLDFSLAVFQPEINAHPSGLDGRRLLCGELGLSEAELNANSPVLLEFIRRGRRQVVEGPPEENGLDVHKDPAAAAEPDRQTCAFDKEPGSPLPYAEPELREVEYDSFFEDPPPQPQKTYGSLAARRSGPSPAGSRLDAASKAEGEEVGGGEVSGRSHSQAGSTSREKASRESELLSGGSLHLDVDDDEDYDDDFNSHPSNLYKSGASVSEEFEEGSIGGPECSDKLEDTLDVSVSQPSVGLHGANYMEEVTSPPYAAPSSSLARNET